MSIFVSLGKQKLPFVKCAMVVDVDEENASRNLVNFRKHHVRVRNFSCYTNPDFKYLWTVYKYIGKEENFAKAVQEIQDRVLICGHPDYIDEVTKMMMNLSESIPTLSIKSIKFKE